MKSCCKIILLLLLPFCVHAQQEYRQVQRNYIDSLLREISLNKKEDTLLVNRYLLLREYTTVNPDSSVYYGWEALKLAERLRFEKGKGLAYLNLASAYKMTGDYLLANEYILKAKDFYINSEYRPPYMINMAEANLNYIQGDYRQSLNYYLPRLKTYKDSVQISSAYTFIAANYTGLKMIDSALYYARVAARYSDVERFGAWITIVYGDALLEAGKLDSAYIFYKKSFTPGLINTDVMTASIGLGKIMLRKGNLDSALWYASFAFNESQKRKFREFSIQAADLLGEIYEKRDPSLAIGYYKLSKSLSDTVHNQQKIRQIQNLRYSDDLRKREEMEKEKESRAKLQRYLLTGGLGALFLISLILVRNNINRRRAHDKLSRAYKELGETQQQLIQREKMASLGELTAGIAHEIQNPLNFVNNFSEVNKDLLLEMRDELNNGNYTEVQTITGLLIGNEEKINQHGKRADAIVKSMLMHSSAGTGQKEATDLNAMAEEHLRLASHRMKAEDKNFTVKVETAFDPSLPKVYVVPQDIGRVLLNVINNALYAVDEKRKKSGEKYLPYIKVTSRKLPGKAEIVIEDNGNGIPESIREKIFQPFFTTKPTGKGTGLGLSMSYDIIKAHGGEIKVITKTGEGTEFIIVLPLNHKNQY